MRKSNHKNKNYRPGASRTRPSLSTLRQQMADFARAELLLELRANRRLSRENAASEIGVTTKTLYEWEHGGKIRWDNAKKVGAFYGVDPETLVTREGATGPVPELPVADQPTLDAISAKLDRVLALLTAGAQPDPAALRAELDAPEPGEPGGEAQPDAAAPGSESAQ